MRRVNQKQTVITRNYPLVMFISISLFVLAMVGIGIALDTANAGNNNAKTGEVKISTGLYKLCDGRNLLYTYSNGIAVSPNDPQCS